MLQMQSRHKVYSSTFRVMWDSVSHRQRRCGVLAFGRLDASKEQIV